MPFINDVLKGFKSRLSVPTKRIFNLKGSSLALCLAMCETPFLAVEKSEESAAILRADILFYMSILERDKEILYLPTSGTPENSGRRAYAMHRLMDCSSCSIVTSREALEERLWDTNSLKDVVVDIARGMETDRNLLEESLMRLGYVKVPLVTEAGQYSKRGFLFDVFPSTGRLPMRIEFFGDVVESIRLFEVDSQRSISIVESTTILPSIEPDDGMDWIEFIENQELIIVEGVYDKAPDGAIVVSTYAIDGEGVDVGALSIAGLGVLPPERKGLDDLPKALKRISPDISIVVVASSEAQAERLKEILRDGDIVAPMVSPDKVTEYGGRISISTGELSEGVHLPGLLILTELEVFGGKPAYRPIRKSKVSKLLTRIDDLEKGDLVVHYDHGIGRFLGLIRQSVGGTDTDLMAIDYAEGGRLYLPLHAIEKIKKYHAEETSVPKLDLLGDRSWQKRRDRAKKKIKDMAEKLLKIYAEREVVRGVSFSFDTELHREFDSFFHYEETADQLKAIEEIKRDMESDRPMDRLLAGDVGYGKTEVAMRAAFKAVFDGKQVAVLVPTTLLCEQHVRIFRKRFSAFPVQIDYLSRFKSRKDQLKTIEDLQKGRVDIVIATHSLLKKDISFMDLGLLIIDEEHRFGVRQKERIKELKKGVDVLALSATPIPRTLQMSLSGIRSMSVIETPPEERVVTKSIVSVFNEVLIQEAIESELERGGQVFFVHNRIYDIEKVARLIKKLIPDSRVAVAHGQMTERALEKIMLSFLNMEIDVLVSTAIVGSGLDIPTANTIIIDMAHKMGLADLYQLKGRVGRSNIKAHAYFLTPGHEVIHEDAKKRLQAIQELNYMGAGFRLAMKDLEIRGAGNLLGAEQSGCIDDVGFDLYIEMLERAVAELKGEEVREPVRPSISIRLSAFIPDSYIEDTALRLSAYRSIASARTKDNLSAIRDEMEDRFGAPPAELLNLLLVMELRLMAESLKIAEISQIDRRLKFMPSGEAPIKAEKISEVFGRDVKFYPKGFDIPLKGDPFTGVKEALGRMSMVLD